MDVSREVTEAYKVWILTGGIGLALLWSFLPARIGRIALVLLTVVATLNYARWGPRLATVKLDNYDLIHYYLNAKYFDELGYFDLYPAAILADHENDGPFFQEGQRYMAQNEAGHGWMPISHALDEGQRVKQTRFTDESWAAFTHDFLWLQRRDPGLNDELWRQLIQDHGYNGTPAWTLMARPITRVIPVEWMKGLAYADLVLLLLGSVAVGWAYGWPVACWAWFFLVTTYSTRWPTITWAFLRYDWVAGLMVALALARKGHRFGAGVLVAYAATLRMFPALWMYGPAAKGLAGLVRRKVNKKLLVMAAGFFVSVGVIEGVTAIGLGSDTFAVHFHNMMDHNSAEQLSSRRAGLALALPFRGELNPKNIEPWRRQAIKDQKPLRYGIAAVVMVLMGWGLRRSRDDEALALGFVPFFLLTTASYYYYVARITMIAMHAGDLKRPRNAVGLAMLLGIEVFCHWAETRYASHRVFLIGGLTWGISAYTLVMTGWLLWEARAADRADPGLSEPDIQGKGDSPVPAHQGPPEVLPKPPPGPGAPLRASGTEPRSQP